MEGTLTAAVSVRLLGPACTGEAALIVDVDGVGSGYGVCQVELSTCHGFGVLRTFASRKSAFIFWFTCTRMF